MKRRVSFVITARDEDPAILQATLDGLRATTQRHDVEVVVVDDGSLTPADCGDHEVRLLRHPHAVGVCQSRRLGALAASGEVLVWLDAHMSFGEGWLEQMLLHVDSGALLCSAFWSYDLRTCYCWGADFAWSSARDYFDQKYPGFGLVHRTGLPDRAVVEVPMVIGACYMMERSSYEHLGGFSPLFRVWGVDEQDISARAWMAGLGVRCVTFAQVGHLCRTAFPYPVGFDHLEFNQLVMLRSLFERETVRKLEQFFEPVPGAVRQWLEESDVQGWREVVQSRRRMWDEEFLGRFAPELGVV